MTTSPLDNNLAIIESRWPRLYQQLIVANHNDLAVSTEENTLVINDIQLTSNYDRDAEARLQASRIADESQSAFIYGPGLGDTARCLLTRDEITSLHIVVLNLAVFLHSLNVVSHDDWLNDSRVILHDAFEIKDVYWPFCANPAELVLIDEQHVALRDKIATELNNDYIQNQFNEDDSHVLKNKTFVLADDSIDQLTVSLPEQVFIAAAGPTLESHLAWLVEHKPFVIAVDAALSTLLSVNIIPDVVVSIDKRVIQLFANIPAETFRNIPLVYFPNVDSRLLDYWLGPRYCSYSKTPMYSGFSELDNKIPLFSSGSVIHPAIDLAIKLGAQQLILLGADFAFVNNKAHATPDGSNKSELNVEAAKHWLFNSLGEKVPTMANFKGYLRDLEKYIEHHPEVQFFSGSALSASIAGTKLWKK